MRGNYLIFNAGHLPVNLFLVQMNGFGYTKKLNIQVIMNLFILIKEYRFFINHKTLTNA